MPAVAGMFLVAEEGLVNPDCRRSTCLSAIGLPFFQTRLFATPLGSLFLGLALRLALGLFLGLALRLALGLFLGLTLRLALGLFLGLTLRLALGLFLGLTLRLTLGLFLGLTLRLTLGLFLGLTFRLTFSFLFHLAFGLFLRLTLGWFSLGGASFGDLSLRLLTRHLSLLRNLSLRSFFTRLLFGSHTFLRVGYPALSIYNRDEKSSKSSDAVNIFEIVFFGQISHQNVRKFTFAIELFSRKKKVSQNGEYFCCN